MLVVLVFGAAGASAGGAVPVTAVALTGPAGARPGAVPGSWCRVVVVVVDAVAGLLVLPVRLVLVITVGGVARGAGFATPMTLPEGSSRNAVPDAGTRPSAQALVDELGGRGCQVVGLDQGLLLVGQLPHVVLQPLQAEGVLGHRRVEQEQRDQPGAQQRRADHREAQGRARGLRSLHHSQRGRRSDGRSPRPGLPLLAGGGSRAGDAAERPGGASSGRCQGLAHAARPSSTRSAARSRAEAAREFASTSSAPGTSAPRVSNRRYAACPGSSTGSPGGVLLLAPLGEELLDQSVLQRVVGQDDDPAADGQGVDRRGQRRGPGRQLAVDLDPQRLERALGRMPAGAGRGAGDGLSRAGPPVAPMW